MARRTTEPGNGVATTNGPPPPSTLAAQIVQNQTRSHAPVAAEDGDPTTFAQLLDEILHNPAAIQETDPQVNVKLITVVAEAGLGRLTQENPFDHDNIISLAVDSIKVMEMTIRRQPEIIFIPVTKDGPELLLVVITRLIAVCGRVRCRGLPVKDLLCSIIDTLSKSMTLWPRAKQVRQICRDITDDALIELDASTTSSPCSIILPPARVIARLFPSAHAEITLPQNCQTTIRELPQALMLCLTLFQAVDDQAWGLQVSSRLVSLLWSSREDFASVDLWEESVEQLLLTPNTLDLCQMLLRDIMDGVSHSILQTPLAEALIRQLENENSVAQKLFLDFVRFFARTVSFSTINIDLQAAVSTWLGPGSAAILDSTLSSQDSLAHTTFMNGFRDHDPMARRTRRRFQTNANVDAFSHGRYSHPGSIEDRLRYSLGLDRSVELSILPDLVLQAYTALDEDQQCTVWALMKALVDANIDCVVRITLQLIDTPVVQKSKKPRIMALLVIHALANDSTAEELLDLSISKLGQVCLSSLHSSVRELRVAASQCLPAFLRESLPDKLKQDNRRIALEYLRALSDRDLMNEHETLIAAWANVGLSCGDQELNLVILRLVQYLGHRNSLVCALAHSALIQMAARMDLSLIEMLAPYWNTVAIAVVQDLQTRPQKIQQVCDLLEFDVPQLLRQTQRYTVPILLLTKKKEVLERIALARGRQSSVMHICLHPKSNFSAIVAFIFTQPTPDPEETMLACFRDCVPEFDEVEISSMIKREAVLIACDMLRLSGMMKGERKARGLRALHALANVSSRKPGSSAMASKTNSKSGRIINTFFEEHILGIMTFFSGILSNTQDDRALSQEKVECIQGVEDMIALIRGLSAIALPQLRAYLQSAMQQKNLVCLAFQAWLTLLSALDSADAVTLLDQTFVLLARYWSNLSSELQKSAHDIVGDLLKDNQQLVQEKIMTVPSLQGIPLMAKISSQIESIKRKDNVESMSAAFTSRLRNENELVSMQALRELVPFLEEKQEAIHEGAVSEQSPLHLSELVRAILDHAAQHTNKTLEATELYGKALGIIGCLDSNRVEASRKGRHVLLLSNFDDFNETVDWISNMLEDVLVKCFKSVSNSRAQGFLAYVMQELLKFCNLSESFGLRPRMSSQAQSPHQRWQAMPENIRITLTPFLHSRYVVTNSVAANDANRRYPSFSAGTKHSEWLRFLVYDLLWKGKGDNPQVIFPLIARIVRTQDLSIAAFLLPYVVLNVVLGGTVAEVKDITQEILAVFRCEAQDSVELNVVKQCSESLFAVLDYMSIWLQEKKKALGESRAAAFKGVSSSRDFDEIKDNAQIEELEKFFTGIPAEAIANRAMECGAYSRALFHWEQYIRQRRSIIPTPPLKPDAEEMYTRLHQMYAQIDEPDGLDGIGTHLPFLSEEQQVAQHTRAGRWTAVQAWFELKSAKEPTVMRHQTALLTCLRETGQYASLLRYADSFMSDANETNVRDEIQEALLPFVAEASWMMNDFDGLRRRLMNITNVANQKLPPNFNTTLSEALLSDSSQELQSKISELRKQVVDSLTVARTTSLQSCHGELRCLHAIYEVEAIMNCDKNETAHLVEVLAKRSNILGSDAQDRQWMLGIKRAAMSQRPEVFTSGQIAPMWIATAKLARKANNMRSAYNAVLKAYENGDHHAKLEEARLLWHDGHQRQAIQSLEASIKSGIFGHADDIADDVATTGGTRHSSLANNLLGARANLLFAKWLDSSGQVQTKDMTERYQTATRFFQRWEKGHYYLGKHYNKLFEAEKALPKAKQSASLVGGELVRLTIENLVRSVPFGNKYWHQTIPKILTLWLDLGMEVHSKARGEDMAIYENKVRSLTMVNKHLGKYFDRIPAYVWYTALSQIISRITHPHTEVWRQLCVVLTKIVAVHPSQALWSIFAVAKSSDTTRTSRGEEILNKLKDPKTRLRTDGAGIDIRTMIIHGQRLTDSLLQACEHPVEQRQSNVGLNKDLGFNHKLAPCALVVPIERTLSVNLPAGADVTKIRVYKAFSQEKITISSFMEDVLVLSSLQRPRKISIRGSDGKMYGLLCKPKDDLRKDQRLMEFNGIINRALKRNAESSKRRLYIKTYAVTPLSEESGTIEWVEGIKPLRDILLHIYARKGIRPNYNEIRTTLNEACESPRHAHLFNTKVLVQFPASLHEWFREIYPEPDTWFASRLRYARSAAVMSMTGHVLGLGDRHGENILLEESTGGVFHVDFNCLFDKGLTFVKPELVPFRLTHNMVDAMGPYGYEGPFRRSSEIALALLRQDKETLMTVLETFLYDPTTDFVGKKKRNVRGVPETPKEILESVERKLKGLLRDETVPLSTEGYVDALIREAVSPFNLASMYIGWCPFL